MIEPTNSNEGDIVTRRLKEAIANDTQTSPSPKQTQKTPKSSENTPKRATPKRRRRSNSKHDSTINSQDLDEFDFDEIRDWSLDEKLANEKFNKANFVRQFNDAKEFDLGWIQSHGFTEPMVFADKSGLEMRIPDAGSFSVSDVKSAVGAKRVVDVMDANTQQALTMTMKEWCEYYEGVTTTEEAVVGDNGQSTPRKRRLDDRLLNVISLEFSHTKLENQVEAPLVVRQLDWIETAWPRHLRHAHTESTNAIDKMKYPKVQKYVLMSVAGCYTDFHIDMGGTSVWYHILRGEKIFWLAPPTEANFRIYEKWTLSGSQSCSFLGDLVEQCQRVVLRAGSTFLMPSGWIHSVYTSKDSLVFGGNFLHSYNVPMQLKVSKTEQKTRVPQKYRYPFFNEIMWFVLERYVHLVTGKSHLSEDSEPNRTNSVGGGKTDLNTIEIDGLKAIVEHLSSLDEKKRSVPKEITKPDVLLEAAKTFIIDGSGVKKEENQNQNPEADNESEREKIKQEKSD